MSRKPHNDNPYQYVLRKRKGEWVKVDRQIENWRKTRAKPYTRQSKKLGRPKGKPTNPLDIDFF